MTSPQPGARLRAYIQFLVALVLFFVAQAMARRGAAGLVSDLWQPLVRQGMLVFLLLVVYAGLGIAFDHEESPVRQQGLDRRTGWGREVALGLAFGWSLALVCVVVLFLIGGIAIVLNLSASALAWVAVEIVFFALLTLAEEVAFRGYGFQRLEQAVGGFGAAVGYAALYGIVQTVNPGVNNLAIVVAVCFTLVASLARLRTRALWVSWGINFGWKAGRALLFGLAVAGDYSHSQVVSGNPMGPLWLTGGGYGLDASWLAVAVLLLAIPVLYRVTSELDFRYNAPVLVPGGLPVDIDGAARKQHEAAMGSAEPASPALIQIQPAAPASVPPPHLQ